MHNEGDGSNIGLVWPFSNVPDEPLSRASTEFQFAADAQPAVEQHPELRLIGSERDRESLGRFLFFDIV